jgi:hypothetical protein
MADLDALLGIEEPKEEENIAVSRTCGELSRCADPIGRLLDGSVHRLTAVSQAPAATEQPSVSIAPEVMKALAEAEAQRAAQGGNKDRSSPQAKKVDDSIVSAAVENGCASQ